MTGKRKGTMVEPRDLPLYPIGEAARLLGVSTGTLNRWLKPSIENRSGLPPKEHPPLIPLIKSQPPTLSFWNLTEAFVIRMMRLRYKVPLGTIRDGVDFVREKLNVERPLIHESFRTNGVNIFLDWVKGDEEARLLIASQEGQLTFREMTIATLDRIEVDPSGLAARLFPWRSSPNEERLVLLDPQVSFGRLVVAGTGIPTEILWDRWSAGEPLTDLAYDYDLEPDHLERVMQWESNVREKKAA